MSAENSLQDWHEQRTYDSMMTYGINAIKFIPFANGGAILAILTFVGSHTDQTKNLKWALLSFIAGVIVGGIVNITAYFTQFSLFNQRGADAPLFHDHMTWLWITIFLIIIGVLCFAAGAIMATFALS